jgi:hypothetical protein
MKWQPLFIPFVPALAAAQVQYSDLNLPRAGIGESVLLVILCAALAGAVVLFEVVKVRRERFVERRVTSERFKENAKRFGLDAEEREFLRELARFVKNGDPNDFFESFTAFEQSVDGIIEEAFSLGRGESDLQEAEDLLQSIRKKLHYTLIEEGQPIVSTRNLSPGQNIWMLGPRKAILGEAVVLMVHELFFSVKLTAKDFGRMPAFESPVRMAFTRKADGIYGIEVPLVSFDPAAGTVKCRHTMKFKRNQLRQDVRVETDLTISVRRIASETAPRGKSLDATPMLVKMTDLSGGGLAFAAEQQLDVGDTILVNATSSKLTISGVQARVLALSQNRLSKRYLYHAQFVNIDFEKKEQIVKYVFSRMRELTQR